VQNGNVSTASNKHQSTLHPQIRKLEKETLQLQCKYFRRDLVDKNKNIGYCIVWFIVRKCTTLWFPI